VGQEAAPDHVGRVQAGGVAQAAAREELRQMVAHADDVDQADHLPLQRGAALPGVSRAGDKAGGEGHQHEQRSAQRQE
jgi:hypothetical protein